MTRLLASIANLDELPPVLAGGADLIDVKNPAKGALGAAPITTIRAIVAAVGGRRQVSATLGDLPMKPAILAEAARRTTSEGVDFVKIGFFPGGDYAACAATLESVATEGARLVAVLFADRSPEFGILDLIAEAGFAGAMLDTADKTRGALPDHLSVQRLTDFIAQARQLGLMTGLAGSLRLEHIASLAALGPDYLGFRGALCTGERTDRIDPYRVSAVRQALDAASNATAAAGAAIAAASRNSSEPSRVSARSR